MYEFPLSKRIENQIKSYFTNLEKIDLTIDENIRIIVIDENNVDPPSIEIKQVKENYELHFWDGYSKSATALSPLMIAIALFSLAKSTVNFFE
jgi:hypothetical protein